MDRDGFDDLTRAIIAGHPRRGLLAGLASGLLVLLPLAQTADVEAKKRRKKEKKKKSSSACTPKCAGKVCGNDGCGGTCGVPCTGGKVCQSGSCVCPGSQQDCQGTCIPADGCCPSCSPGEECFSGTCVNLQGTCASGADSCQHPSFSCGGALCACRTTVGGQTRCGSSLILSDDCTSTADCVASHPDIPGVFCWQGGQVLCGSGTFCSAPCPE
jgi:hypothetical protein